MPAAAKPENEAQRLAALRSYDVLDTVCEASFDNIAQLTARLLDCPVCMVSLIDAERQWFKAQVGLDSSETDRGDALCAHAILNPREPLIVHDATCDDRFSDSPLVACNDGIRFYAGAPLVNAEGAALGTLCVLDRTPRQITSSDVQTLQSLADAVMTTLELRRAMIRVRDFALLDPLTGIANRTAFLTALETSIETLRRQARPFILLYLDLDGFKEVNDRVGHAAGDEVLRQVALTLSGSVRTGDTAARLGGDEFAIVMAGEAHETEHAAERVCASIEALGYPVTASVGAICFTRSPGNADDALTQADQLMYAAKRLGKNRVTCAVEQESVFS